MATDIFNEANPIGGGTDTVEPAVHPAANAELKVTSINHRLATSEQTPSAPWTSGDAGRLARHVLRRTSGR